MQDAHLSLPMSPSVASPPGSKLNLLNLTPTQATAVLGEFMAERGEPAYRVQQVLERLWQSPIVSFDEITTASRTNTS